MEPITQTPTTLKSHGGFAAATADPRRSPARRSPSKFSSIPVLTGGFISLLGCLVLAGWYTRSEFLVRLRLDFPPMPPNTALAFLISGIGFASVPFGSPRLIRLCGHVTIALSLAAFVAHYLRLPVGWLDAGIILNHPVLDAASARMSPLSAVCFMLFGITLIFLHDTFKGRKRLLLLGFIGAIILTVGIVTIWGYLTGMQQSAYGWGASIRMSFHTAVGFVACGLGLLALMWHETRLIGEGIRRWPLAVVGVVTASLCLWQVLRASQDADVQRALSVEVNAAQQQMLGQMNARLLALVRMATMWEAWGRPRRAEWEFDADMYLRHYSGYHAIGWADRAGRVHWAVPLAGGQEGLAQALALDGRSWGTLEASAAMHAPRVSHPLRMPNGETKFLAAIPVHDRGRVSGFLVGLFRFQPLLDGLLANTAADFSLTVSDGGQPVYTRADSVRKYEAAWHMEREVALPGATWRIRLWPTPAQWAKWKSPMPEIVLVVGLLIALLLSSSFSLAQMAQMRAKELEVSNARLREEVAERRQVEQRLANLNEELEGRVAERTKELAASNRELEAFSYSVSHDLRAPLRAIEGFSGVLLEEYAPRLDHEGRRLLQVVRLNTKRMGQLIDDLLAFAHVGRQQIERAEIDMARLARATFEELKVLAPGRTIVLDVNGLPPVHGDQAMIRQVFANLIGNAIKFTRPRERAVVEIGGEVEETHHLYYVKDNGVGFDMRYVGKLFGVFQRLHASAEFEGTGVGLAIVQRIVQRHGGRVWAHSVPEEGSTFLFTLPRRMPS